jgi:putative sigma-54 modulation protein
MQIKISARHGHIGEKTQSKIEEKLEKLPRLYDRITAIELTINLEHEENPKVDLKVSGEHKAEFLASSASGEMWAAIDEVTEKIEQQLRKYKGKAQDRHRGPGRRQEGLAPENDSDD